MFDIIKALYFVPSSGKIFLCISICEKLLPRKGKNMIFWCDMSVFLFSVAGKKGFFQLYKIFV